MNRPTYNETSLSDALKFNWHGWHLSRKVDGIFAVRLFARCEVVGEATRDGVFHPFDLRVAFGQDVEREATTVRMAALGQLMRQLPAKLNWRQCESGFGAEFIEAVLAAGGEGCVAKPLGGRFGEDWFKIKRYETFDCRIEAKLRNAVLLSLNGEPAGKCPLRGANYEAAQLATQSKLKPTGEISAVLSASRALSGFVTTRSSLTEKLFPVNPFH